jgi:drug/metabolite transporter (DMT)-like permease
VRPTLDAGQRENRVIALNAIALARARDWALLVLCNLIWASSFVWIKLVQSQVGPIFTTLFPAAVATALLILLETFVHNPRHSAGNVTQLSWGDVGNFLIIGIFGQGVAQLAGSWGTQLSLASNGAVLFLALPISTAIMAYFLLGERMTRLRWISFALAIVGVIICSDINWTRLNFTSSRFMLGNILLLLSVFGSAFYNVFSKRLLQHHSPLQVQLYSYIVLTVVLLPVTFIVEPEAFHNLRNYTPLVWLGLLLLAVFQYFLSLVIFLRVLSRLDATQAGLSNYMIPAFGVVVAAIVLHERLTIPMILGGCLVLASTLLITVFEQRMQARVAPSLGEGVG